MDALMWNRLYGLMKLVDVFPMFLKSSAYVLCSNSRNFFVIYRIWAYE
jgi:hypothetical protein